MKFNFLALAGALLLSATAPLRAVDAPLTIDITTGVISRPAAASLFRSANNIQTWDADLDIWATKTAPSGTVLGTGDFPYAVATKAASSQIIPNGNTDVLVFDNEVADSAGCFASNAFTAPRAGMLIVSVSTYSDGDLNNSYYHLYVNGSSVQRDTRSIAVGSLIIRTVTFVQRVAQSDVIDMRINNNTGGDIEIYNIGTLTAVRFYLLSL